MPTRKTHNRAVSITAAALNLNIFEFIATWTEEHFSFTSSAPQTYATEADEEKLQQLRDCLAEKGYSQPLVPTYIPDGFQEGNYLFDDTVYWYTSVYFESITGGFDLSIDYYTSDEISFSPDYQKDPADPVIYQKGKPRRIGSRKGVKFVADGHDIDDYNDEIEQLFGVSG